MFLLPQYTLAVSLEILQLEPSLFTSHPKPRLRYFMSYSMQFAQLHPLVGPQFPSQQLHVVPFPPQ